MPTEDVLFAGATGLIGALALPKLLARPRCIVHAVARRELPLTHPRLHTIVASIGDAAAAADLERELPNSLRAFVCALGTTLRAAGSRAAFVAVDHDLVVRLAALARRRGARQAIVVSSVGADARSRNFYLRVKGDMEEEVAALGFERVDFLHPGLLLGQRREHRGGERIAQALAWLYNPLLAGALGRYRAIDAERVAAAIPALLDAAGSGRFAHENAAMESRA